MAETDLARLLVSMSPRLTKDIFVFATLPASASEPAGLEPLMRFREAEGVTLVLPEAEALQAGLNGAYRCRMITLEVHSALEAVGFLAAVATRLAAHAIPVNPVSAFHHDHLFVPEARAEEALRVLLGLAAEARR